jgi:hypothetical protein
MMSKIVPGGFDDHRDRTSCNSSDTFTLPAADAKINSEYGYSSYTPAHAWRMNQAGRYVSDPLKHQMAT